MVEVYFNLHKRVFSVRDVKTRRVIAHTRNLILKDVTFKVSEAGRQRVLREKRKNVHAVVRGEIIPGFLHLKDRVPVPPGGDPDDISPEAVKYNPYKYETFVTVSGHRPVKTARFVSLRIMEHEDGNYPVMVAYDAA